MKECCGSQIKCDFMSKQQKSNWEKAILIKIIALKKFLLLKRTKVMLLLPARGTEQTRFLPNMSPQQEAYIATRVVECPCLVAVRGP